MSRMLWCKPSCMVFIFLSISVEHKQAANVGGSGQNVLKVETTTEEVTTSRGLLVSNGSVNFTVQSGTRVTLHCRVELHDENASVSWLRRKGDTLQLLTVNMDIFKDDPRYKINFIKPIDWQLYIDPVNFTDQGYYECQVSSHPPIVHSVYLHVVENLTTLGIPGTDNETQTEVETDSTETDLWETTIYVTDCPYNQPTPDINKEADVENEVAGNESNSSNQINETKITLRAGGKKVPELEIADERNLPIKNKFYNSGSTIELRCLIVKVPQPTQFIIWKHNSSILNYDTTRGGISVKTDILPDGAKSQLYIANVGPTDSGNYSCSLGEQAVTWVSVVVITGETPAAMQHGSANKSVNLLLLTILSSALSALS